MKEACNLQEEHWVLDSLAQMLDEFVHHDTDSCRHLLEVAAILSATGAALGSLLGGNTRAVQVRKSK